MVDQIRIQANAGDGRNGGVNFRHAKFVPRGGQNGALGGKAATSFWRTDVHTDDLLDFYF